MGDAAHPAVGLRVCAARQELVERKQSLEAQILALRNKIEVIERRQVERRLLDDKRRQEEVSYLKHQAKHLDLFLKSMPKI
jgi:hypothetical protein